MKNFSELAKARFSARKFDGRDIPEADIQKIVEAGVVAPTAVNFQPIKIFVFKSEESRAKVLECTNMKFIEPAKVIIGVGSKADEAWERPFDKKNFGDVDASIVATHIMLSIHDLGYGSTWIGHFDPEKLAEFFPETKDYSMIALFPVSGIAEGCAPSERHEKYRGRAELVSEF